MAHIPITSKLRMSFLAATALLTAIALPSLAQSAEGGHAPTFSIEAPVVLVPTTVMDRKGAIVSGLPAEAFAVSQDNIPQHITSFAEQDIPVSIGIVFDTSGSMRRIMARTKDTLKAFLETCNPEDEAFLYNVATKPQNTSSFTKDFGSIQNQMIYREAGGSTPLVDTIFAAMLQTRHAHNARRALLIISDGMDNDSRYTAAELTAAFQMFQAVYDFAAAQGLDRTDNFGTTTIGKDSRNIFHPDYFKVSAAPDKDGRNDHFQHMHFQIGTRHDPQARRDRWLPV